MGSGIEILFEKSWSHDHSKSSSPEPMGRFPRNLACSSGDSSPS